LHPLRRSFSTGRWGWTSRIGTDPHRLHAPVVFKLSHISGTPGLIRLAHGDTIWRPAKPVE
jgi:hypothetical protein